MDDARFEVKDVAVEKNFRLFVAHDRQMKAHSKNGAPVNPRYDLFFVGGKARTTVEGIETQVQKLRHAVDECRERRKAIGVMKPFASSIRIIVRRHVIEAAAAV